MAAAGFRTRRIASETSIGDRLKKARTRKKISVTEVEEATRIRSKFILALESDSWEHIPSEVYGRGYLETYAAFLKLPVDDVMRDYDKMRSMYARRCQQGSPEFAPTQSLRLPRFIVTPKMFVLGTLAVAVLGFGGVVYGQFKDYASAPYLVATAQAAEGSPLLLVTADTLTVNGKTASDAAVYVNNEQVSVAADGSFSYQLRLQKGVNAAEVVSKGRNGKESKQVLSFVAK